MKNKFLGKDKKIIILLTITFLFINKNFCQQNFIEIKFPFTFQGAFYPGITLFMEQNDLFKINNLEAIIPLENDNKEEQPIIKYNYLPKITAEKNDEEISSYKYFDDNRMRYFTNNDISISLQKNKDNQEIRVYKEDKKIKQKKYDEKKRLLSEIIWIEKNDDFEQQSEKTYFYLDNAKFPNSSKTINYTDCFIIDEKYNQNNLLESSITYSFELDKDKKIVSEKVIEQKSFVYDKEKRIITKTLEKNNLILLTKYDYSKKLSKCDEIVYENDQIKSKLIYLNDDDYNNEIFLPDGYSVKTVYENNKKKSEIFYHRGVIIRNKDEVISEN